MNDTITLYPQRIGTTDYLPADKVDVALLVDRGLLNDTAVQQMRHLEHIGEATPANFRVAVARRPAGSPWPPKGFKQAYLEEAGLVEKDHAPPVAPAPVVKQAPAPAPVTHLKLADDKIAIGAYFLIPSKRGHFTFYTAVDAAGRILRDTMFRSEDAAQVWLEALSTAAPAPDTQGAEPEAQPAETPDEEQPDDGDVQPEPGAAEG